MKITSISDIHGYLIPKEQIGNCDVLTISGDILPVDIQTRTSASLNWLVDYFIPWTDELDCEQVIFIAGNHDFVFQQLYKNADEVNDCLFYDTKIKYLQDTSYIYNGVKFYGTPHVKYLKNWAFYADDEYLDFIYSKIPGDTDILLTHDAPNINNHGTVLQKGVRNTGENYGCNVLKYNIMNVFANKETSVYVLCGHIHSGNHNLENVEGTNIYISNVSIKDERYNVKYKPLEFVF